jgi:hypothetical protein
MPNNSQGRFDKLFHVLSNFFQIIGTIAAVIALLIAVRAYANPQVLEVIVSVITGDEIPTPAAPTPSPIVQTVIVSPTPVSIAISTHSLSTNTPVPTNTAQPQPTETPTLTPTGTPTNIPTNTATSTPTPTPIPPPEFFDSFDSGFSPLWTVENLDDWGTVDGQLVSNKPNVEMSIGNLAWSNYGVELTMISGVGKRLYRPCANITCSDDPPNYCRLRIMQTAPENSLDIQMNQDSIRWFYGDSYLSADRDDEIQNTEVLDLELPYTVRVTAQLLESGNTEVITYINGEQVKQISRNDFQNGYVSLFCKAQGSFLDDFSVTPLSSP